MLPSCYVTIHEHVYFSFPKNYTRIVNFLVYFTYVVYYVKMNEEIPPKCFIFYSHPYANDKGEQDFVHITEILRC